MVVSFALSLALSGVAPVASRSSVDPLPSDETRQWCRDIEAESAKILSKVRDVYGESEPYFHHVLARIGRCVFAGRGAWIFVPENPRASHDYHPEYPAVVRMDLRLTHVSPEGERVAMKEVIAFEFEPEEDYGPVGRWLALLPSADYDGDGVSELVVRIDMPGIEDYDSSHHIYSLSSGTVGTYPPLAGIDIVSVGDYDRDGRLDIISIEAYWSGFMCLGMYGHTEGLPPVLFHAREDGSFSPSDDVAATFLRRHCPAAPSRIFDVEEAGWDISAFQSIACLRLWGRSVPQIQAKIRREWRHASKHDPPCDTSLAEYLKFATIEPPVILASP